MAFFTASEAFDFAFYITNWANARGVDEGAVTSRKKHYHEPRFCKSGWQNPSRAMFLHPKGIGLAGEFVKTAGYGDSLPGEAVSTAPRYARARYPVSPLTTDESAISTPTMDSPPSTPDATTTPFSSGLATPRFLQMCS